MPYKPDLIPPKHRVLIDHFKAASASNSHTDKASPLLLVMAMLCFLVALYFYRYVAIAALLAVAGSLLTAAGKKWIEQRGRFILTSKIRTGTCVVLGLLCIPFYTYYQRADATAFQEAKVAKIKAERFSADSLRMEDERRDSLSHALKASKQFSPAKGLTLLDAAKRWAVTGEEQTLWKNAFKEVSLAQLKAEKVAGHYKSALAVADRLLSDDPSDAELFYQRASCNLKLGAIRLAVKDLDSASMHGHVLAKRLYNQVNPLRRRVAYYVTRCSDGTTSSATGRGACSWHGGVANWNDPVYEEYRKY